MAGPKLWNALRDDIMKAETVCSFKSKLKTFLFQKAYNLKYYVLDFYFNFFSTQIVADPRCFSFKVFKAMNYLFFLSIVNLFILFICGMFYYIFTAQKTAFVCCFIFVSNSTVFYKKYSRYLNQTFRHNL